MANVAIRNVTKKYGALTVLNDVSISIDEGEFLILVGPSGCGKSTLLNLIAGLDEIAMGEIEIGGQRVNDLPPKDRDIAMVFQSYALYPSMSVRKNITFGLEVRGVPKPEREELVRKVADLLQIGNLLDRRPSQLSGGQRQRVAIGRALVRDPKLFLFDEPLSNLDAKLRVEMRTEIKTLQQRLGTTIIYVTHDQIEAMTMASKIAVMNDGIVQQFGAPQEIYDNPANVFVAGFIGSPPMNLIPATIGSNKSTRFARIALRDDMLFDLNFGEYGTDAYLSDGQQIIVGLRPEDFTIRPTDNRKKQQQPVGLYIEVVEPTGPDDLVITSMGGTEVVARLDPGSCISGQNRELFVDINKVVLFDSESGMNLR